MIRRDPQSANPMLIGIVLWLSVMVICVWIAKSIPV
jgi:hypothetical protein